MPATTYNFYGFEPNTSYFASVGSSMNEYGGNPAGLTVGNALPNGPFQVSGGSFGIRDITDGTSMTIAFREWRIGNGNDSKLSIPQDIIQVGSFPRCDRRVGESDHAPRRSGSEHVAAELRISLVDRRQPVEQPRRVLVRGSVRQAERTTRWSLRTATIPIATSTNTVAIRTALTATSGWSSFHPGGANALLRWLGQLPEVLHEPGGDLAARLPDTREVISSDAF